MQFLGIPSSDASGQKKWGDKRDLVMALTSFVAANRRGLRRLPRFKGKPGARRPDHNQRWSQNIESMP